MLKLRACWLELQPTKEKMKLTSVFAIIRHAIAVQPRKLHCQAHNCIARPTTAGKVFSWCINTRGSSRRAGRVEGRVGRGGAGGAACINTCGMC